MANREIQPEFRATLKKTALTPDELKSLITSKVDSVLLSSNTSSEIKRRRIIERRDDVIQCSSLSETTGNQDKRRKSTKIFQNVGITPAPTDQDQNTPSPSKTEREGLYEGLIPSENYKEDLIKEEKESQDELFRKLSSDGKLDQNLSIPGGGLLQRNNTNLTAVELCTQLDSVARSYAAESIDAVQGHLEARQIRNEQLKPIIDSCFRVTLMRISLMSLHGDDILSVNDYDEWKKHVCLIASFATLTIALGLFFDQPIELLIGAVQS